MNLDTANLLSDKMDKILREHWHTCEMLQELYKMSLFQRLKLNKFHITRTRMDYDASHSGKNVMSLLHQYIGTVSRRVYIGCFF